MKAVPRPARNGVNRALLLSVHWLIISFFLMQVGYATFQVFWVLAVEGGGPLFFRASEVAPEILYGRRLYAIEGWLAGGALIVYLAVTEIGPRLAEERARVMGVRLAGPARVPMVAIGSPTRAEASIDA